MSTKIDRKERVVPTSEGDPRLPILGSGFRPPRPPPWIAAVVTLVLLPVPLRAQGPASPAGGSGVQPPKASVRDPETSVDASEEAARPAAGPRAEVRRALSEGDLSTARDRAVAARKAHPDDPRAWALEAEVLERMGDLEGALAARRAQRERLAARGADVAEVDVRIRRIEERMRGAVPGEPPSTRAARKAKSPPPPNAKPKDPVRPPPARRNRIVTKWYFWVTVAAIVASAAAITGIAIRAARTGREDALDEQADDGGMQAASFRPSPGVVPVFRF